MERHPISLFYVPLFALLASAMANIPSILVDGPTEARVTRAILAIIPLIGCLLLVRFRSWPK